MAKEWAVGQWLLLMQRTDAGWWLIVRVLGHRQSDWAASVSCEPPGHYYLQNLVMSVVNRVS